MNPGDVFKYCLDAIPDESFYYRKCLWDHCTAAKSSDKSSVAGALCSSFDAMSQECSDNFVNVMWRNKNRCRKINFENSLLFSSKN